MTREEKHLQIRALLREDAIWKTETNCYNCLPETLRSKYDIVEVEAVASASGYDPFGMEVIHKYPAPRGWVLDCGAGCRGDYHPNVVNYEVVAYPSTEVLGVAEELPFRDGVFDGVLCLNVLEHVKDPFKAAREIARVLKPGGSLYCVVPFLQPMHGYPHHYYNMTSQGLHSLFDGMLRIDRQEMLQSGLPIWTMCWFLRNWADDLSGTTREEFLNLRVGDVLGDPVSYLDRKWVTELSRAKNFELASTTAVFASKPARPAEESR